MQRDQSKLKIKIPMVTGEASGWGVLALVAVVLIVFLA